MSASPYRSPDTDDSREPGRRPRLTSLDGSGPQMHEEGSAAKGDARYVEAVQSARTAAARESRYSPDAQVAPLPELTATGAALSFGVVVSLAGIIDRLLSPGLGVVFGFVFILASVYTAIRMCWRDAWAALALPPLVFVVAAGVSAQFSSTATGGWVSRTAAEIASAVLAHPIYLLTGTLLAGVCLAYRARVE